MAVNITDDDHKWILKRFQKTEYLTCTRTLTSSPKAKLMIYRIRKKFETTESTTVRPVIAMQLTLAFTQRPQKSKYFASPEFCLERKSLGHLMHHVILKMYTTRLIQSFLAFVLMKMTLICA